MICFNTFLLPLENVKNKTLNVSNNSKVKVTQRKANSKLKPVFIFHLKKESNEGFINEPLRKKMLIKSEDKNKENGNVP